MKRSRSLLVVVCLGAVASASGTEAVASDMAGSVLRCGTLADGSSLRPDEAVCDGSLETGVTIPAGAWGQMEFAGPRRIAWLDLWGTATLSTGGLALEVLTGGAWQAVLPRAAEVLPTVLRVELPATKCAGIRVRFGNADTKILEAVPAPVCPYSRAGEVMLECGTVARLLPGALRNSFCVADLPEYRAPTRWESSADGGAVSNGFLCIAARRRDGEIVLRLENRIIGRAFEISLADLLMLETVAAGDGASGKVAGAVGWNVRTVEAGAGSDGSACLEIALESTGLTGRMFVTVRPGEHFARFEIVLAAPALAAPVRIHAVSLASLDLLDPGRSSFFGLEFPRMADPKGQEPHSQPQDRKVPQVETAIRYFPGVLVGPEQSWTAPGAVWGVLGPQAARHYWLRDYNRLVSPVRVCGVSQVSAWGAGAGAEDVRALLPKMSRAGIKHVSHLNFATGNGWDGAIDIDKGVPALEALVNDIRSVGLESGFWLSLSDHAKCFLWPGRTEWIGRLQSIFERYGNTIQDFDFYEGRVCCPADGHGHPAHSEGLYAPYWNHRAFLNMCAELRRSRPGLVLEGHVNLGRDAQIARALDVCHTGYDWAELFHGGAVPEPDAIRRNMVWSFSYALNCVWEAMPNYRMFTVVGRYDIGKQPVYRHDPAAWEDALALGLMLSPNVAFYGPHASIGDSDLARMRAWLQWSQDNRELLRWPEPCFSQPGLGKHFNQIAFHPVNIDALQAVQQVRGGRGFFALYNPTCRPQVTRLVSGFDGPLRIRQRYPTDADRGILAPKSSLLAAVMPRSLEIYEVSSGQLTEGRLGRRTDFEPVVLVDWEEHKREAGKVFLRASFPLTAEAATSAGATCLQIFVRDLMRTAGAAKEWDDVSMTINGIPAEKVCSYPPGVFGRNFGGDWDPGKWSLPAGPCLAVIAGGQLKPGLNEIVIRLPDRHGIVLYGGRLTKCWWR